MERDGGLSVTEADGGGQVKSYWRMEGAGALIVLALVGLGAAGWVMNIMKIAEADTVTPFVILRCVGAVIVFLGMILGWIG